MMLTLYLAAIITAAAALPAEGVDLSPRIAEGITAPWGAVPFMASVTINGHHTCGGSLLGPDTVLTAAHCIHEEYPVSSYKVSAGSLNHRTGGTVVGVRSRTPHRSYNSTSLDNDIAILKLSEPIPESSSISYAKLPQQDADPHAQADASIAGWGVQTSAGGDSPGAEPQIAMSTALQTARAAIMDRNECSNQIAYITEKKICIRASAGPGMKSRGRAASRAPGSFDWTGGPAMPGLEPWTGERGVCTGDSGGPVGVNGEVVGVTSYVREHTPKSNRKCQRSNEPAVATRVGKYVDGFIKPALQDDEAPGGQPRPPSGEKPQLPPDGQPQLPPDGEPQPPPDSGTDPQQPPWPPGQGPPGQGPQSCPPGCISLDSLFNQPPNMDWSGVQQAA